MLRCRDLEVFVPTDDARQNQLFYPRACAEEINYKPLSGLNFIRYTGEYGSYTSLIPKPQPLT